MGAYWSEVSGRYGTGESYDYFPKYEDGIVTFESEDELWTYTNVDGGVEILRYNGDDTEITIPTAIEGEKVVGLTSTFDGFVALEKVTVPEGVIAIEGAFYGCENLKLWR